MNITDYHSLNVYDATGSVYYTVMDEDAVNYNGDTFEVEYFTKRNGSYFIKLKDMEDEDEVLPLVAAE